MSKGCAPGGGATSGGAGAGAGTGSAGDMSGLLTSLMGLLGSGSSASTGGGALSGIG